jgi:hypothetical protein
MAGARSSTIFLNRKSDWVGNEKIRTLHDERNSPCRNHVIYGRLDMERSEPFPDSDGETEREGIVSDGGGGLQVEAFVRHHHQPVAITIHSAKGLDFGCVFLFGLDAIDWGKDRESNNEPATLPVQGSRERDISCTCRT